MTTRNGTTLGFMLLVAIVGALAACGQKNDEASQRASRATEVPSMFAELHMREQQYYLENVNEYVSTGDKEGDAWPTRPPTRSARAIAPLPATWQRLGVKPPREQVYCSYVAVAGKANNATGIGPKATEFGFAAPAQNWYYLLAECDADGDPTVNAYYFSSGADSVVAQQNVGR
jgi:hypothetical protein